MKYQLLLRDIYKYTERAKLYSETESLRQAMQVMQVVPKAANDMMDVGRLQGFDVSYIQLTTLLWYVCLNVGICTRALRKSGYFLKLFLISPYICSAIFCKAVSHENASIAL